VIFFLILKLLMFKERISQLRVFVRALQQEYNTWEMRQDPRIKPKQLLTENEAKTYVFNNCLLTFFV